ncbi:MAG: amidophosphoribosyltransferase [Chloroflexota bacterium]|nr:amidophosphoribosyltransferase [Chloroflexota bacterium]
MDGKARSLQPDKREDLPHEECGVVGIYTPGEQAARLAFFGLFALQHRGQESAGIAASDGARLRVHADMGLVSQAFREDDLQTLEGHLAIGHTRYSTTGSSKQCNAQPIVVSGVHGQLALGHNGNVINARELRLQLQKDWDCTFTSTTDSEAIAYLLVNAPGQSWEERISYMMRTLQGAYSLVALAPDSVIGIRDPLGVRPLCLGKINGGWVIASESCALDHLGATYLRELAPGEAVIIDKDGLRSYRWPGVDGRRALCVFEIIYFARPDSVLDGKLLYATRKAMGAQLAREHPVDADLVIGIPDSATAAAVGYSQESCIPFSEGLVKNRYVGRTFIEPDQRIRDMGVRLKFNPLPEVIAGKRLVVVDDSIVRGTTTPHVVRLLRHAGAKEVHMRVCAPPIAWPCHFGVDMATRRELLAANKSIEEIRRFIGADTLGYLSIPGLLKTVGGLEGGFCSACFTGQYPIPVQLEMDKLALENM